MGFKLKKIVKPMQITLTSIGFTNFLLNTYYNISICKKEKIKDETSKKNRETNGCQWDLHWFLNFFQFETHLYNLVTMTQISTYNLLWPVNLLVEHLILPLKFLELSNIMIWLLILWWFRNVLAARFDDLSHSYFLEKRLEFSSRQRGKTTQTLFSFVNH